jgi:hypothetical protein
MKLYAFRSPAVEPLWRIFRRSVRERTSFELVPVDVPSEFDGCHYGEQRFWEMTHWIWARRREFAIKEREVYCTSGCDSVFLQDPVPHLRLPILGHEFLAADDLPLGATKLCCCFQCILPGLNVLALHNAICSDPYLGKIDDEIVMNTHRHLVDWAALPHAQFWNLAPDRWHMGEPVKEPPADLVWFHANYTIGLAEKLFLLKTLEERAWKLKQSLPQCPCTQVPSAGGIDQV